MVSDAGEDIKSTQDPYYIRATSSRADENTRVLKHGDTFAVFDPYGDIRTIGLGEQGLYHEGTRFLSHLALQMTCGRPMLLSSTVNTDNALLDVDLSNPDLCDDSGEIVIPRETLHISRTRFLLDGVCHERLRIRNYGLETTRLRLFLRFDADFADIFEVRGMRRDGRGRDLQPVVEDRAVVLGYEGLDSVTRRTRLSFTSSDSTHISVSSSGADWGVRLAPQAEETLFITISCEIDSVASRPPVYQSALTRAESALTTARSQVCRIHTANEQFDEWLDRSISDLLLMVTETSIGPYPYAGVPWYSTAFGRDGIVTALETLWVNPAIAKGVLGYLASTQAKDTAPETDAEPGKILHETRSGEMAALGEIPFGRYYGSVDGTPLFVMLARAYYQRTGDKNLIASIWPNIELALNWIDDFGDLDGDGFVEYSQRSATALHNQGWKDSTDCIFHADGTLAQGPIALCEVQGYVYAAKRGAAELAAVLGHPEKAAQLRRQAGALQQRFEEVFWSDELSTYAIALDGDKRPCLVRTSNAGHSLFAGIASQEHARRTMETLMSDDSFSGWGIRTVAASEARYNPMSYHNGSVWPHDNALIAFGMSRYGFKEQAIEILARLFNASIFMDLHRLPELFCGFPRRRGEGPILYPLANAPQSWASAAVLYLLQACLGISIDASREDDPLVRIRFSHPVLPDFIEQISIEDLRVGNASVDLALERYAHDVGVNVARREGDVEVLVVK